MPGQNTFGSVGHKCSQRSALDVLLALAVQLVLVGAATASDGHLFWPTEHPFDDVYEQQHWMGTSVTQCSTDFVASSRGYDWVIDSELLASGEGRYLHGTHFAQREIWKNQFPDDCASAKFLVVAFADMRDGVGSILNVIGTRLEVAMELGRVFILERGAQQAWMGGPDGYCAGMHGWGECYFEAWSSCTLEDALRVPDDVADFDVTRQVDQSAITTLYIDRTGYSWKEKKWTFASVPSRFTPLLVASLYPTEALKHTDIYIPLFAWVKWWRAQAVAFLARPNARTRAELTSRRAALLRRGDGGPAATTPLRGVVAVHVRRGDKWRETAHTPLQAYLRAVRSLLAADARSNASSRLTGDILLSTEDAGVLQHFMEQWPQERLHFVEVPRYSADFHDHTEVVGMWQQAERRGPDQEFLDSLLSLQLALEADAWVQTLSSNWCRLVNELRATLGCKAHRQLLDASEHVEPGDQ